MQERHALCSSVSKRKEPLLAATLGYLALGILLFGGLYLATHMIERL